MQTHHATSSASEASVFFLQHKDLFEFDKYVGGGPITASAPSFLSRYRECERLQVVETAQFLSNEASAQLTVATMLPMAPFLCLSTSNQAQKSSFSVPTSTFAGLNSVVSHPTNVLPQQYYSPPSSPSRLLRGGPDPRAFSLQSNLREHHHHAYEPQDQSRSPQRRLPSPQRSPQRFNHAPPSYTASVLPKLSDLLIDTSSRAVMLGPGKSKVDEAKKIELLLGSKCVGRVSAASHLPAAIRHRLEASAIIHKRRENLYLLLKGDYARLTES